MDDSASSDPEFLTFDLLDAALTRCMAAHPPSSPEFVMHPDANTIAGPWAGMIYERFTGIPFAEVKPKDIGAYRRWSSDSARADTDTDSEEPSANPADIADTLK